MLTTTFVLKWWLLELWGGRRKRYNCVLYIVAGSDEWLYLNISPINHPLLLAVIVAQFNEKEHVPCWICKVSGQNEIRAKLYCEGLFESV